MLRLRCGTILLDGFLAHLAERDAGEDRVTTLEYIGCASGERAGQQWARLGSAPRARLPDECLFAVGEATLCMSPQTQQGLRDKWVDYREGSLVVG